MRSMAHRPAARMFEIVDPLGLRARLADRRHARSPAGGGRGGGGPGGHRTMPLPISSSGFLARGRLTRTRLVEPDMDGCHVPQTSTGFPALGSIRAAQLVRPEADEPPPRGDHRRLGPIIDVLPPTLMLLYVEGLQQAGGQKRGGRKQSSLLNRLRASKVFVLPPIR